MNPLRPPGSGLSDPPKFLAQLESQALERFGTGLLPEGVSPIQKMVVTICSCHGYFSPAVWSGFDSSFEGATLKSMLSRSFMALSVNRAALSGEGCAKTVEARAEIKPKINVRYNPFSIIK